MHLLSLSHYLCNRIRMCGINGLRALFLKVYIIYIEERERERDYMYGSEFLIVEYSSLAADNGDMHRNGA